MSSRILIVRTSALGDVVHCLPVLTALRRAMPDARVAWLVEDAYVPLLEGHPDIDRLLPVGLRRWRRRPLAASTLRQVGLFLQALDRFSAEIVLDLMGNHKAGILGALSLADRRLGLEARYRREPSSAVWISRGSTPWGEHAVERALAVLGGLGLDAAEPDFGGARLCPAAPPRVDGREVAAEPPYVAVLPGATWGNKRYPSRWWGRAAELLGERTGLGSWIVSGPGEEALAREAGLSSRGWARVVHGGSLPELVTVLRHARLVMGADTGPLHLAHALDTPVLCLMGPTDPARTGPFRAPERALWRPLPCSFCHRRMESTRACLLTLSPETVAARASELLAPPSPPG